jgi:UDP-N-acetylglucosamine 3-dehydrogenase
VFAARRPHRVVVLGVGAMGRRHVRVLAAMPDVYELMGVFDAAHDVAEEIAAANRITAFDEERDCIDAADLVVIASPIEAHAGAARRALEKGRHVLVEKPLSASSEDAFALVRVALRHSALLFVGHSERFNPVIDALGRIVGHDAVRAISIRRATPEPPRSEHGVLLSLGVHDVDLVAHLTGSALELRAVTGVIRREDEVRAEVSLVTAKGAAARLMADREAARRERTIELVTDREVFEGDLLVPRLYRRPRGGGRRTEVDLALVEPLAEQAREVAAAIDGQRPPRIATGADGARALALALRARDWLREGQARRVG